MRCLTIATLFIAAIGFVGCSGKTAVDSAGTGASANMAASPQANGQPSAAPQPIVVGLKHRLPRCTVALYQFHRRPLMKLDLVLRRELRESRVLLDPKNLVTNPRSTEGNLQDMA